MRRFYLITRRTAYHVAAKAKAALCGLPLEAGEHREQIACPVSQVEHWQGWCGACLKTLQAASKEAA